ncbi:MAG: hypothetical protein U0R79_07410 [Propionicimonas sp.]
MALFRRSRPDFDLAALVGRRRVRARVRGSAEAPCSASTPRASRPRPAREVGWHEIEHGVLGPHVLHPALDRAPTAGRGLVVLTDTGHLPDLFNERATASIACVRTVDLDGTNRP